MVLHLIFAHKLPRRLRHACLIRHELCERLIHSDGGGGNVRSDIGDARKLQETLDRAVLAVFAVQHREDHVDPLAHDAVALKAQQALSADGRDRAAAVAGFWSHAPLGSSE